MLRKPSPEWIDAVLRLQRRLPFAYCDIGATRDGKTPDGYRGAVHRICLGEGAEVFALAKQAIRSWRMFPRGFVDLCWPGAPIEEGSTVGVLCRTFGLWTLHVARIVYVIDERECPIERFGFAYGTLPRHFESGEELFLITWDRSDNRVWYEVRMFSRPAHWVAWLGDLFVRRLQRKFGKLTKQAMFDAVAHRQATPLPAKV